MRPTALLAARSRLARSFPARSLFVATSCVWGFVALIAPASARESARDRAPVASIDPALYAGLEARSIGPATMSGRVAAIDAVEADPNIVYLGAATGGLWKSHDAGINWQPIFDDQPVAAIGAVEIFQPSPEIVWVGTGEGNPRNSVSVGNGVYKTVDGGKTWRHLGLDDSERIHRIVLHPSDAEVAWVAAMGPTWGQGGDRGVYKTTDGGTTWEQVLSVSPTTGAVDLVMDPANPRRLLAAMWDHRRWPWSFRSGGPGSGLFESRDGGESWKRLGEEEGLPAGDLGRIGLAISPSHPNIAYAFVEAEGDAHHLLRSTDGGVTWSQVANSQDQPIGNRPFYYAEIRVDPVDPDIVYSLWSLVSRSTDGGRTWSILVPFSAAHPDHHALWIDPASPTTLYLGNDGGFYASADRGANWRFAATLPLSQLYHVRVDDATPFNVYFGLQDNGSWRGPSEAWDVGGIRAHRWEEVNFGDGFDTLADPDHPDRGWAMSQEGFLVAWDLETGARRPIMPQAPPGQPELRYNWNAALGIDPFDSSTIYFGSQFVHRSRDKGMTWETISGDLTTNEPEHQKQAESGGLTLDVTGAENFTTLTVIAPSRHEPGVLWVGSDDGRLHITRDAGATWERLDERLPGLAAGAWIPHIEPSRHQPGEAFVVFDDHRRSSWIPYLYRTRDYGATWTRLVTGSGDRGPASDPDAVHGYALSVVQDPVDPELLYLGTEFGLWISQDDGASWWRFRHGVPTVSVMDLAIQERDDSLVLGTHGRGVFVIDDLEPLRTGANELSGAPLHVFPPEGARQLVISQGAGGRFVGTGEFFGENPPYGARLFVWLGDEELPHPDEDLETERKVAERETDRLERLRALAEREGQAQAARRLDNEAADEAAGAAEGEEGEAEADEEEEEVDTTQLVVLIEDADGEVLRRLEQPAVRGIQRVVWDFGREPFRWPPSDEPSGEVGSGPALPPGTYTVRVEYGEAVARTTVEVAGDPRLDVPAEAYAARFQAIERAGAVQEALVDALIDLEAWRADLASVRSRLLTPVLVERARRRGVEAKKLLGETETALLDDIEAAETAIDEHEKAIWNPDDSKGIPSGQGLPWSEAMTARWMLLSAPDGPAPAGLAYLERAEYTAAEVLDRLKRWATEDLAPLRERVREAGVELLRAPSSFAAESTAAEEASIQSLD